MLPTTYDTQVCSIARTLEIVGERWTLLILREVFLGRRRFVDFEQSLGIARTVLVARLTRLCDEDILERRRYQDHPPRDEYRLTAKGRALWPVLIALLRWGDEYAAPAGPPVLLTHTPCGHDVTPILTCPHCREEMTIRSVVARPGPGADVPVGRTDGLDS